MPRARRNPSFFLACLLSILAALPLAGCGGGGGSAAQAPATSTGTAQAPTQQDQLLGLLVPAYFDAGGSASPWNALIAARQNFPGVPITAILNPSDGIFSQADAGFTQALAGFTGAGGKVVGYVMTQEGQRALADVESNIDDYVTYYGAHISGIFLDEMGGSRNLLPFYASVASHVRSRYPGLEIIGNPGTYPDPGYADVADTLVIFENPMSQWNLIAPQDNPWVHQRSNAGQAIIADGASCGDMQKVARAAATTAFNVGWVYVTDGSGSNPWAALPSYWDQLLGTVNALNTHQALPTC